MGVLARGGLTWLVARSLALRAEIGARGAVALSSSPWGEGIGGAIGLDALVGLVLRV